MRRENVVHRAFVPATTFASLEAGHRNPGSIQRHMPFVQAINLVAFDRSCGQLLYSCPLPCADLEAPRSAPGTQASICAHKAICKLMSRHTLVWANRPRCKLLVLPVKKEKAKLLEFSVVKCGRACQIEPLGRALPHLWAHVESWHPGINVCSSQKK